MFCHRGSVMYLGALLHLAGPMENPPERKGEEREKNPPRILRGTLTKQLP